MFDEYRKSLRDFYLLKKAKHRLSVNLEDPGREKIRNESVEVFLRKNTQRDKDLIQSVFDPTDQSNDLIRSIEKFNLDKFRAVVSFLVEGKSMRDEKLVKLTAWLLDFPPYNEWRKLNEEEKKKVFSIIIELKEEEINEEKSTDLPTPESENDAENTTEEASTTTQEGVKEGGKGSVNEVTIVTSKPIPYLLISCLILLIISTGSFFAWRMGQPAIKMPGKDEKCMYWKDDHFEPVNCKAQGIIAPIIPLNMNTLRQQRKINLSDTLTNYSIGKVWYSNIKKSHEFFTDSGVHPLDTVRRLRPLTPYIISNHISYHRFLLNVLLWTGCILLILIPICLIIRKGIRKNNLKI